MPTIETSRASRKITPQSTISRRDEAPVPGVCRCSGGGGWSRSSVALYAYALFSVACKCVCNICSDIAIMRAAMGASTTNETELVESWHTVLAKHAQVSCALERALGEHGLGPSEYEVLERLATSDCEHLRMQELAETRPPEPERALARGRTTRGRRPGRAGDLQGGSPRNLRQADQGRAQPPQGRTARPPPGAHRTARLRPDSELDREQRRARRLRLRAFGNRGQRSPPCCREHAAEYRGRRGRRCAQHFSEPVASRSRGRRSKDVEEALTYGEVEPDQQGGPHGRGAVRLIARPPRPHPPSGPAGAARRPPARTHTARACCRSGGRARPW